MTESDSNDSLKSNSTVQIFDAQPGVSYSLEAAAHLTGISRRSILIYCKSGLVNPISDPEYGAMTFDEQAIYMLRKIEVLRAAHGVNLAGIKMIFELMQEVRRLEGEIRFHRIY